MKIEKNYTYLGDNGYLSSTIHIPGAYSVEKLRLSAEEGKILHNKQTKENTKIVMINPSDLELWEEIVEGTK